MPGFKHPAIEIGVFSQPKSQTQFNITALHESDLTRWLREPMQCDSGKAQATLKLFSIDRALDVTLGISKDVFHEVFKLMHADPSVLYMIHRDYDGFHEYHGPGYDVTRFVGTPLYGLFWTFDCRTCTTTGIFFHRQWDTFRQLGDVLRTYQEQIYYSHVLSFVSVLFLLEWFDMRTSTIELAWIQEIENHTGFGPYRAKAKLDKPALRKFDINELTQWSQRIGEVAGNMTNKLRHQRNSQLMLDLLKKDDPFAVGDRRVVEEMPPELRALYERNRQLLIDAIPSVEKHMLTYAEYLAYLKDRSERLAGVVCCPFSILRGGGLLYFPKLITRAVAVRTSDARGR